MAGTGRGRPYEVKTTLKHLLLLLLMYYCSRHCCYLCSCSCSCHYSYHHYDYYCYCCCHCYYNYYYNLKINNEHSAIVIILYVPNRWSLPQVCIVSHPVCKHLNSRKELSQWQTQTFLCVSCFKVYTLQQTATGLQYENEHFNSKIQGLIVRSPHSDILFIWIY